MEYQVIISRPAWRDIGSIGKYIAQDNPEAAKTFCGNLLLEARGLNIFPDRGQKVARSKAQRIVHRNYIIFYEIDFSQNKVEILRFWHAAQNQRRLRLKEENPEYSASPDELKLRRHQLASGEGAVIPGDEILLQQSQSQQ